MAILLVALHVMVCFILIVVILIQGGRGQGLTGGSFTGGGVQSLLGTRAADFLTKATSVSAILFLFTCIGLDIYSTRQSRSLFRAKQPVAPVDVQQIQKVLEKMKAEELAKTANQGKTASPQTESLPTPRPTPPVKKAPEKHG